MQRRTSSGNFLDQLVGPVSNPQKGRTLVLTYAAMAPTRSSLKQGTLSFASAKRTASTSITGKPKKATKTTVSLSSESGSTTPEHSLSTSSAEDSAESFQQPSKSLKRVKEDRVLRPAKRRHVSPVAEVAPRPQPRAEEEVKDGRSKLDAKDRRWIKLHAISRKRTDFANQSKMAINVCRP